MSNDGRHRGLNLRRCTLSSQSTWHILSSRLAPFCRSAAGRFCRYVLSLAQAAHLRWDVSKVTGYHSMLVDRSVAVSQLKSPNPQQTICKYERLLPGIFQAFDRCPPFAVDIRMVHRCGHDNMGGLYKIQSWQDNCGEIDAALIRRFSLLKIRTDH